jgi:hypothetical protein
LLEAAPTILPPLPERVQKAAERELRKLGVEIHTAEQVCEVTAEGVRTRSGLSIPANLTVWTAGVNGPAFLRDLDGLEVSHRRARDHRRAKGESEAPLTVVPNDPWNHHEINRTLLLDPIDGKVLQVNVTDVGEASIWVDGGWTAQ